MRSCTHDGGMPMRCPSRALIFRRLPCRRGRSGLRAAMLAAAGCLAASCLLAHCEAGTLLAGRHRTDRTCSLQTVLGDDISPSEYCVFLPGEGENRHKRVLIQFGESNCEFTLRSCTPGYCYAIRDFSGLLPRDIDIDAIEDFRDVEGATGIFKNATVEGADAYLTTGGLFFSPQQSDVKITYTTKSCAEYYHDYGREWPQLCDGKLGMLSNAMLIFESIEGLNCTRAGV